MLNYGLDFEYNKNTGEATVKNTTDKTMYDIEMLFRVSHDVFYTKCKYKRLRKIKAGETIRIKFSENDIKNIELMKYIPNDKKEYTKLCILKSTSAFLYIFGILFFIINSLSIKDTILGIMFLTLCPSIILIMDWGARYDHRKSEESYYKSSIVKPL